MKKRPGVMLYFDRLAFLDRLSDEQAGRLLRSILAYAEYGVLPEIDDLALGMAWDVIRPVLDYDRERYEAICEKRRQSVQKRWNTNVSSCIPNTNTDPNQTQTQTQTETQIETQTYTQPQPESADFSPVVNIASQTTGGRRCCACRTSGGSSGRKKKHGQRIRNRLYTGRKGPRCASAEDFRSAGACPPPCGCSLLPPLTFPGFRLIIRVS